MLQLVLGQSGSGKSYKMRQLLCECSQEEIIFLVPEQSSFDAEKTICNTLPPHIRRRVEVLSFSRLCDNIFRRYGGLAGERIGDSGKSMLMSVTLDTIKDELEIYKNYHRRPEFIQRMTSAVDEFKNAGLTPEHLKEICEGQTGTKVDKLRELSKIYSLYTSVLENQGIDSRDDLLRAQKYAQDNRYFDEKAIFIDGFKDFTGAQMNLVCLMLSQCENLTVSLCTDGLDSDAVMFVSPNNTALSLIREAKSLGVEVKTPLQLLDTKRSLSQDLSAVAENFLRHDAQSYDGVCENVTLYCAKNPREEAEYIAASIGQLVKEKGFRYRDIAVVGRNTEEYLSLLNDSFLRYGIPVYDDSRDDISSKPLVKLITAFITASRNKNDVDSVFTMLKSPFSPFDYEKVCEFENYAFVWSLNGKDLRRPLKNHPDGLGHEFDETSLEKLNSFEEIRTNTIQLIDDFWVKTENCDGLVFAQEIYKFLENFGVLEKISENNDDQEVEVFNCTISCLEQMATVLKGMNFGIERMEALLKTALVDSDYGKIPRHLDEVTVGCANRIRYSSPKAVFVFGAVDGKFPALIKNDAIVGWEEREFLRDKGVNIPDNEKGMYADERYFAYMAVSAPSEKLFVSYPAAELSGNVCFKSLIVLQIEKILLNVEHLTCDNIDRSLFLQTRKSILHEYAERFYEDNELSQAVKLTDDGNIKNLEKNATGSGFEVCDTSLSAKLFGKDIKLSASQVESFHRCRFSYFCEKGLKVKPLQKIEMDPLQSGNFIHYCLYYLLSKRTKEEFVNLSYEEISNLCDKIAEGYLKYELAAQDFSDQRFITLMMRMKATVKRLATRLQAEFRDSDFVPVEFEAKISADSDIKPLKLTLPDGATVRIEGAVDRVDMLERDGEKYIRVIDYKSGTKDFKADDLEYGLNMQMLLYLFAICDENSGKYAGAQPAGILYMPVGDKYEKSDDEKQREKERLKQHRMKGLVLCDERIIRAMENSGEGKFIPVKFKKDGTLGAGSTATLEEFSEIKKTIDKTLCEMGMLLRKGKVAPYPTQANGYNVCKYCRYTSVCKRAQLVDETE